MKITVTITLELECQHRDKEVALLDLEECLDEAVSRREPLFGSTEVGDAMHLTAWRLK